MAEGLTSDRRDNIIIELLENSSSYQDARKALAEKEFRMLRLLDPIELPIYYVLVKNDSLPEEKKYNYRDFQALLKKIGYQNIKFNDPVPREGETEVRLGTLARYVESNSIPEGNSRRGTDSNRLSQAVRKTVTAEALAKMTEAEFVEVYKNYKPQFRDYQKSVTYYVSKYILLFLEYQLEQFKRAVVELLRNERSIGRAVSQIKTKDADHSISSLDYLFRRSPLPWSVSYIEDDLLAFYLDSELSPNDPKPPAQGLIEYFCGRICIGGSPDESGEFKAPDFFPWNGKQYFSALKNLAKNDSDRFEHTTPDDFYGYKVEWNHVYDYLFSMLDIDQKYLNEYEARIGKKKQSITHKAEFIMAVLDGDKEIGRPNLIYFLCAVKAALFEAEKEINESIKNAKDMRTKLELMNRNPVLTRGRVDHILDQCSYKMLDENNAFDRHAIDLLEIDPDDSDEAITTLIKCVDTLQKDMFELKKLPVPLINNLRIASLGANSTVNRNSIEKGKRRDVSKKDKSNTGKN